MAETKMMSVVTVPLKTEKWQEDILEKRFELCRKVYNNMLGYEIKQLNRINRDEQYVEAKALITEVYQIKDEKEKKARKKTEEYKQAVKTSNELLKEYGLTEFAFISEVQKHREVYKTNISSTVASRSIAKPMWAAMNKYLFGNGKKLHFKRYGTFGSVVSDGKSGIRMVDKDGNTIFSRSSNQDIWVNMSVPRGRTLLMPVKIDKKDLYKIEMLSRKLKTIRITRKLCGEKYKYYAQITVEGAPAIRYDKDGNVKNPVGNGKVGMYIDTTSITLALEDGSIKHIPLYHDDGIAEKIADIQRYMDNSRRAMNPDNYNDDGTIKPGIMVNGKKQKLHWVNSNGYNRARLKLKNIYRVESEKRTLERQVLANHIIALGDTFIVNDYPFQYAAMQKKTIKEDTGETERRKKTGYIIGNNAPATLVTLMDTKLTAKAGHGVQKVKLEDIDYKMDGYREHYARYLLKNN